MLNRYATAPFADRVNYQIGQAFFRVEDFTGAAAAYDKVITQFSGSELLDDSINMKGMCLFKQDRFTDAIAIFRTIDGSSEFADDALYQIGTCYYNMGQYDIANSIYRRVIDEFPDSDKVTVAVSGIMDGYLSKGQLDEAIKLVDDYLANSPEGKLADNLLLNKGDLLFTLNKLDESIRTYRTLISDIPASENVPFALDQIGRISILNNDNTGAEAAFEELRKNYPDHDLGILASMKIGDMRADAGRAEEAIGYYEHVEKERRDDHIGLEASYKKGLALIKSDKAETAMGTFNDIISRSPDHIMAQKSRLELAENAIAEKKYDEAVKLAEIVINNVVDDNAARAQYIIGNRYFVAGDFETAQYKLMRITMLYENYEEWIAEAKLLIARCQSNLGEDGDAVKTLEEVIEAHPRDDFGKRAEALTQEIKK